MQIKSAAILVIALSLIMTAVTSQAASVEGLIVSSGPKVNANQSASASTTEDRSEASSRLPILEAYQLPQEARNMLQIESSGVSSQAYGAAGGHPFTTKRASTRARPQYTIRLQPYASTGKLWVQKGGSWYVCTASLIEKGVLVTAAHCVWDFGGDSVDVVEFEPARHGAEIPFGVFTGVAWAAPGVYADGTDVCDALAPGVVCENDIAVVVLDTLDGRYAKDVVRGKYGYKSDDWGFVPFADGKKYGQITQFGYPVSLDSGTVMIRTDSIGYQLEPNNLIIGSDQTGGASGGPWLMNFGATPQRDPINPAPMHNGSNKVVATTSWAFTDGSVKIMGASRFAKNTTFTDQSNIEALHAWACENFPAHCD